MEEVQGVISVLVWKARFIFEATEEDISVLSYISFVVLSWNLGTVTDDARLRGMEHRMIRMMCG